MADQLKVDLEAGNAAAATAEVQKFKNSVVSANAEVNALAKPTAIAPGIAKATADVELLRRSLDRTAAAGAGLSLLETRADAVRKTFQNLVKIDTTGSLDAGSRSALRFQKEAFIVQQRLKEIAAVETAGKSAGFLKILTEDAATAEITLARLEKRALAAAAAAKAADVAGSHGGGGIITPSGQLRGLGPAFRAAGLTNIGVEETTVNAGLIAAKATAAEFGTTLASIGTTIGVGALAILSAKFASEGILKIAEGRLKSETAIAVQYGQQQKFLFDINKSQFDFANKLAGLPAQRAFDKNLTTANPDDLRTTEAQLQAKLALDEKYFKLRAETSSSFTGQEKAAAFKSIQDQQAVIEQVRNARLNSEDSVAAKQAASFNQRNEDFKKNQADAVAFEKAQTAKRIASINEGRLKVAEFGKTVDETFSKLFAAQGDKNPFTPVFDAATESINRTRIATAALSSELQKQAADMVKAQNANALFAARLDNALNASNLRAEATAFRVGGVSGPESDADFEARINRTLQKKGFNPDDFKNFSVQQRANFATVQTAIGFDDAAALQTRAKDAANLARLGLQRFSQFQDQTSKFAGFDISNGRFNGVKLDDLANGTALNNAQRADQNLTIQDRLNRQLAVINDSRPENEAQRAEADRRIIALTQGANPGDLTDAQRDAAAGAREREATRLEGAETAARAQRDAQTKVQTSIDKNIGELLKIAQSDGLTGVIRIINEAEDRARESLGQRKRVGDKDVKQLMD